MELQDSGNRREFDSGAVRDINEGKGRCDLLPLGVVADMIDDEILYRMLDYREGHKLDEWREFCEILRALPHVEVIRNGK